TRCQTTIGTPWHASQALSRPPQGKVIYRQGSEVRFVYFPITAMYSLVLNLDTGEKVEVATIGNEGFVGLPVYFRLRRSPYEAMLQVEGETLQVPAKEFF